MPLSFFHVELLLLVRIQLKQEKYQEALDALQGPKASILRKDVEEHLSWVIVCQQSLGLHQPLLQSRRQQVELSADDWVALKGYIQTFLQAQVHEKTRSRENVRAEILQYLRGLQKQALENKNVALPRAPFLAECEMEAQFSFPNSFSSVSITATTDTTLKPAGDVHKLIASLASYFSRFGHKVCHFNDVQSYMHLIVAASKDQKEEESYQRKLREALRGRLPERPDQALSLIHI